MKNLIVIFAVISATTIAFAQNRMPLTPAYLEKIGDNYSSVQVYLSGELILTKVEKDQKAEIKKGKLVENSSTKTTEIIIRYKERGQITEASDEVSVKFDTKHQEMNLVFEVSGSGKSNSFVIKHDCQISIETVSIADPNYNQIVKKINDEKLRCLKPFVQIGDDIYIISNKNVFLELAVVTNSKSKKEVKKSKGVKVK